MSARLTPERFVDTLRTRQLAAPGTALSVARAPGRLDVMGGIADYSGSLVLQRPIAEATFAAVQRIERSVLEIVSLGREPYEVSLADIDAGRPVFTGAAHWASYVVGPLIMLMRERGLAFQGGVRVVVASDVPEGKGVSSSAALETAVMRALIDAFELSVTPRDMALLCQRSENLISNAPCGVMDQMACVFGEADRLLALLCQPAELLPSVPLPAELTLWGIDSGERHAVGGSDYRAVRIGAFIGLEILRAHGVVAGEYLANVPAAAFDDTLEQLLPDEISGATFLRQYGGTIDPVTAVDPAHVYKVRVPTSHPVHEHDRVTSFRRLLANADEANRRRLGELMYQSHASYSACGLGSPGTDRIVELVRGEGPDNGLYGARITGGGSGGTVAVLGRSDASNAINRIVATYEAVTGYAPYIFSGSSSGVALFGAHRFTL